MHISRLTDPPSPDPHPRDPSTLPSIKPLSKHHLQTVATSSVSTLFLLFPLTNSTFAKSSRKRYPSIRPHRPCHHPPAYQHCHNSNRLPMIQRPYKHLHFWTLPGDQRCQLSRRTAVDGGPFKLSLRWMRWRTGCLPRPWSTSTAMTGTTGDGENTIPGQYRRSPEPPSDIKYSVVLYG
jgi:hypothetical protein